MIIILTILYINTARKDSLIQKSHFVVCAEITDMRFGKGTNIIYQFKYSNKVYHHNQSASEQIIRNYKKGKKGILVVFQKENPNNARILYDENTFIKFNIHEADTVGINCESP
jgi:hypothetical protein